MSEGKVKKVKIEEPSSDWPVERVERLIRQSRLADWLSLPEGQKQSMLKAAGEKVSWLRISQLSPLSIIRLKDALVNLYLFEMIDPQKRQGLLLTPAQKVFWVQWEEIIEKEEFIYNLRRWSNFNQSLTEEGEIFPLGRLTEIEILEDHSRILPRDSTD